MVYSLDTDRLMAGLQIYNADRRFGTDEEAVELLGRITALMNNSETPDPIFDAEDEVGEEEPNPDDSGEDPFPA